MAVKLLANGITFWAPDQRVGPVHILIQDEVISRVSDVPISVEPEWEVFDLGGRLVVPGFVDAHTHLAQSFGRGIYDNLHMTQWLVAMSHNFNLTPDQVYVASLIGCIEAIKSGTTTVAEMTSVGPHVDPCIQAIADSGLRAVVGACIDDLQEGDNPPPELNADGALQTMRGIYSRWHGTYGDRITMRVSPVGLPACTEGLMRGSRALANELGVGIHTHCCEGEAETNSAYERFGCSEVEALYRFGVLGPDVQLVHCVWLTERDKQLIAETGSSVVYCPSTNTKITDGIPPMPDLFRLGVNIALGCDGEASSGTYDMLQEARLASLLAKGTIMNAAIFTAEETIEMMTRNGARAVGLDGQVGVLEVGRKADVTVIDYPQVHLIDERRLLSNLIYSATGGDVDSVFVSGRPLMWRRELVHLDEKRIMARALEMMRSVDL